MSNTADFFRQNFSSFPPVNEEEQYTSLLLDVNKISDITDDDLSRPCFSKLKIISLAFNQLKHLPSTIGTLTELTQLICHGNQLEDLPDSLSGCTKLNYANFVGNRLTTLPVSFRSLKNIARLILSDNFIKEFPIALLEMTSLETLDLSGNPSLKSLPEDMSSLVNLRKLRVNNAGLTSLPMGLPRLPKLTELDAGLNELDAVTANIADCLALKTLNLSYNNFTEVCKPTSTRPLKTSVDPPFVAASGDL